MTVYHHIALNVPLGLLTYAHHERIEPGMRVLLPFRGRTAVGIVWAAGVQPEIDPARIRPVQTVFDGEAPLPESWRQLVSFASRYYHYPIGQAAFTALPQGLKEAKAQPAPQAPVFYTLNDTGRRQTPPPGRHVKKAALWQALSEKAQEAGSLKALHPQAGKLLAEWEGRGWLDSVPAPAPHILPSPHTMNGGQAAAVSTVSDSFGRFHPFLLHGITGSGKTEVYFNIMAQVLASGRQVLFLLPEINLTPQLLARVAERFSDVPAAVLHSQTAAGRRSTDYLRAMLGQARLVIGTRLAVFTPLPDLGLLVVDEEHDTSFKQESELRYHARDLAVWRAQQAGCPVVLGSATPSLESWHKAQSGAYRLLTLDTRAHGAARPPETSILDIRRLPLENGISAQALALLKQNRQEGGLSLVYLNRRGFAPALFCSACGHTFGCPNCSAKMVLHRRARQLRCHHCDFRLPVPNLCPDCGNQDLSALGQGTQRIEDTLRTLLPQAEIMRVDRDTTARKSDWDTLYQNIRDGRADILVGTQMLAKGHDFPRLNLVLVLNADGSLFSADFRAPERLFAELMQVSGRAGRANRPGRVLIQTRLPEHPVFAAVRAQDYAQFAAQELPQRRLFDLPPYGFQAALRADAPMMREAVELLENIKQQRQAAEPPPENVSILGPAPMLMARLAGLERAQVFLESPSRQALHREVSQWIALLQQQAGGKTRWSADIDPQEM